MTDVAKAISCLRAGDVIGLPTETVYGLAADGTNPSAVARIFEIKGRPVGHPLILHLGDKSWLSRYCIGDLSRAQRLADRFWPGPLTLILVRNPDVVPNEVTGGLETVGVRVPGHPLAQRVILELGKPLAAPSANRFGGVSPTTREHVIADLGQRVPVVLDGGPCSVGIESTILDLSRPVPYLLRPGAISIEQLSAALGEQVEVSDGNGPAAPGTLESHYAPTAQVIVVEPERLWETARQLSSKRRVGVLAFGDSDQCAQVDLVVYRVEGGVDEIAQALYAGLRALDKSGCDIIVSPIAELEGVGLAINDRLGRAAAPRPDR